MIPKTVIPAPTTSVGRYKYPNSAPLVDHIYMPVLGNSHGAQIITLYFWFDQYVILTAIPQWHPGSVIQNHLLNAIVHLKSLGLIALDSGLF